MKREAKSPDWEKGRKDFAKCFPELYSDIMELYKDGYSINKIAKVLKCSKPVVYRATRKYREWKKGK